MIGVVASEEEHAAVREFFELFKTPWQFHREGAPYQVLICSSAAVPQTSAKLILIYGAEEQSFDREHRIESEATRQSALLKAGLDQIPIYGACRTFKNMGLELLTDENTGEAAAVEITSDRQTFIRIGFDLFAEIKYLLTLGQPVIFAHIPTLDLHIAFLRDLMTRHSVPLLEIPPVPAGHDFIACLTHDVDHPRLRAHLGDHTMFGFLYRAVIGSLVGFGRGRRTLREVAANYRAALSLPFVYLGIAQDFWNQFDRYLAIEGEAKSTFFVIPAKGNPGEDAEGRRPPKRAARYNLADIASDLRRLISARREIAVHGIDAWRDPAKGRAELERIRDVTGASDIGIRMHWLFFSEESVAVLEQAGYSYDSTVGYNNAVGYRAGTMQAFKPLAVQRLLELPMHLMDTAMFYPSHMNLSPTEAATEMNALMDNAVRFGGVLTVNWHDRSIAPERLWDAPYVELVKELKRRGAWMPTAAEAVSWFRERRAATIDTANLADGSVRVSLRKRDDRLPGFRLRAHRSLPRHSPGSDDDAFTDFTFMRSDEFHLATAEQTFSAV